MTDSIREIDLSIQAALDEAGLVPSDTEWETLGKYYNEESIGAWVHESTGYRVRDIDSIGDSFSAFHYQAPLEGLTNDELLTLVGIVDAVHEYTPEEMLRWKADLRAECIVLLDSRRELKDKGGYFVSYGPASFTE